DGIRDWSVTGVQTCALPISLLAAALEPMPGRPFIDVARGVLYRRPPGVRRTRKRQPAVALPGRLMAHIRRWQARGARFLVEWNRSEERRVGEECRTGRWAER